MTFFCTEKFTCRKIAAAGKLPGLWITPADATKLRIAVFEASADAPLRDSLFFSAEELYCVIVQLKTDNKFLFQ